MSHWHLCHLFALDAQLRRIPKGQLGELAKRVYLRQLGALTTAYDERLLADGKLRHRKTGPKGKRAKK